MVGGLKRGRPLLGGGARGRCPEPGPGAWCGRCGKAGRGTVPTGLLGGGVGTAAGRSSPPTVVHMPPGAIFVCPLGDRYLQTSAAGRSPKRTRPSPPAPLLPSFSRPNRSNAHWMRNRPVARYKERFRLVVPDSSSTHAVFVNPQHTTRPPSTTRPYIHQTNTNTDHPLTGTSFAPGRRPITCAAKPVGAGIAGTPPLLFSSGSPACAQRRSAPSRGQ